MSPTSIVEKMHQIKKQSILFLNVNYSPRNAPFPRSAIFAELVSTNLIPAILYQEGKGMSIQMRCKGEKAAASNDAHFAFELRGEKGRLLMWELSVQRRKTRKEKHHIPLHAIYSNMSLISYLGRKQKISAS